MDFTFDIHRLTALGAPVYNVLSTQMEGTTKKTRLKSTRSQRKWEIEIRMRSNSERDEILTHWDTQKGTLTPFNWVLPSFYGGETIYVRYVSMEYSSPEGAGILHNFVIQLEEAL